MRSIFARILIWLIVTIAVSLLGFIITERLVMSFDVRRVNFIARIQALQHEGALAAYEEGGPTKLARYLQRLDKLFEAEHCLLDARGKDLRNGADRSTLQAQARPFPLGPPGFPGRPLVLTSALMGGTYLLIEIRPPEHVGSFLPLYLWVFLLVLAMLYALAVHLARPLRGLRRAVDRLAGGDLSTRIGWTRRDEFGELARAFDRMAERIETLMTAQQRLLQDVSHELRSPLTRLKLAVRLAKTHVQPPSSFDRIQREVDRLSGLVDELLQLATAEGDPRDHRREEVALDVLIAGLVEENHLEAESKLCQLAIRETSQRVVVGDRELLRRAIENVLRNAIRHAPEHSEITVDLRAIDGWATMRITDRGAGVPDEALLSIFEPFFRVDSDRSRLSGGVGLGLAIALRAVTLHGGKITATNLAPGFEVAISLPVGKR